MKYLILSLLLIGCVPLKKGDSVSVDVVPVESTPTSPSETDFEEEVEVEPEEITEENANGDFDLEPRVELVLGIKYTFVEKEIVFPWDLEVGEYGLDFGGSCEIYRTAKGIYVTCEEGACSELKRKYLVSRYKTYYLARKKNKRVNRFRDWMSFKRQRKYERCESDETERRLGLE